MWVGRRVALGVAVFGLTACGDDAPPTSSSTSPAGSTSLATTSHDPTSTSGPSMTSTSEPWTHTTSGHSGHDVTTDHPHTSTTGEATSSSATSSGAAATTSTDTGALECPPGDVVCDGAVALKCDENGEVAATDDCESLCLPGLGCVDCVPGTASCEGAVSVSCGPDGHVTDELPCDPVQGLACAPDTGRCVGACAPDVLGASYIGCDYYPTITPNVVDKSFGFAVAVSNTTEQKAHVTISRGAQVLQELMVPPGDVELVPLPWISGLKSPTASALVQDGAYRVRSDRPVTVYQYSPLEYSKDEMYSYSNDASLLLPTNVWGKQTRVVARNTFQKQPGAYVVVARRDDTVVDLKPSATGAPVVPGGGVGPDGSGKALLGEGDALIVISGVGGGTPDVADVTGTLVSANYPVQVIGAHACTNVPHDKAACDHLEESILPIENLAQTYLLTTPLIKPPKQPTARKARLIRVVATADATTLTYEPPQPSAPTLLKKAGDHAEFTSDQDFELSASARVVVAEYMLGQTAGGGSGDPAMTIAVPPALFRPGYAVHAPTQYESNFVNLVAPVGVTVSLDGKPIAPNLWEPIGKTGWSAARVQLLGKADGDHLLSAELSFGVQVYGYGQYTSYWYPGGLDLDGQ